MRRTAIVLAIVCSAAFAGPGRSDPSYTVPPSEVAPAAPVPPSAAASAETNTPPANATPPPAVAAPTAPAAKPAPATDDAARYSFHRIGDQFVRLDSQTGQVAQCGWGPAGGWSCKVAPDERAALESEIGRLQRENVELKRSLLSRGLDLPSKPMAEAPATEPHPVPPAAIPDPAPSKEPKGPSEGDVNRAIAFMKHVWQRLVDLMVDLQRDIQRKS